MKRKLITRVCAAAAALLLVLPIFTACATTDTDGEVTNPPSPVTSAAAADTTAPETVDDGLDENGYLRDTLPADLNFGGKTITTLYWQDREREEFFVEGINGEIVNDAIYTRNQTVEERLGITLDWVGTKGNSPNINNYVNVVRKSVDSGDRDYDLLAGYSLSTATCALHGLTQDLLSLDYLNFDMPWWPKKLTEQSVIKDKLYFCSGDISASVIYMMYVTFFNKQLIKDYNLESPYDLVLNDKWTMDKMIEMSTGVYKDLNGDSQKSEGDQFGLYMIKLHSDALLWGSGTTVLVNRGKEGLALNEDFTGERVEAMLEKFCRFLHDGNDGMMIKSNTVAYTSFAEGETLFCIDRAQLTSRDVVQAAANLEYGIVPVPKYDHLQDSYSCVMANPFTLYAIPIDNTEANVAAAVMECMASESYRTITPALFETTLKTKQSKDEASAQMLDIARSSVVFDLGRFFLTALSGLTTRAWETCIYENIPTWISYTTKALEPVNNLVTKLNDAFE